MIAPRPDSMRWRRSARRWAGWFLLLGLLPGTGGTGASAVEEKLWSLQPVRKVAVPRVTHEGKRVDHPVDAFILKSLAADKLPLSPEADRRTLIRRLSFALIGLPPAAGRVEQFVADADPRAYEKLVDELLASPYFGERWARHWMDVVRYADTHGTEHDAWLPHAWRYRDYLIRAFNDDLPYDQFVREHIAGDLLPQPRWDREQHLNESLTATAWWRLVEFNQTPVDVKAEEVLTVDHQIDAFSKAFLGLTVSCARCHDHKFDPIPQRDWHGLYSILASTRTSMRTVDDPARLRAHMAGLTDLKTSLRAELAASWKRQLLQWPDALKTAGEAAASSTAALEQERTRWMKAFGEEAQKRSPALTPLLKALQGNGRLSASGPSPSVPRFADFAMNSTVDWFATGDLDRTAVAGEFSVAPEGTRILDAIYPAGRYSHLLSDKQAGTLRSPNFTLTNKFVSALVCGDNNARVRVVLENFQGDSLLFDAINPKLNDRTALRWVTMRVRETWLGRRAYLELVPRDDMTYVGIVKDARKLPVDGRSAAGIREVVLHDGAKLSEPVPWPLSLENLPDRDALQARFVEAVGQAIDDWAGIRCDDTQALFLNALLQADLLDNDSSHCASLVRYREIEARIPVPTRVVAVVDEGPGLAEPFFNRGDHLQAGKPVPRQFLQAFGKGTAYTSPGSGRLELAQDVITSPLAARVMANRMWHHLFGAGLVRTTDNFGKLGETPSHPELLDWLAGEFTNQRWSVKSLVRLLVTTRTFRSSVESTKVARARDPENRLLSHAHLRRLDGESLRDAILHASGRLDVTPFGPGVPVVIPKSHEESYSPQSGPLDGNGRRSLYLEVRRNHPDPFLCAFDQPNPVSPAGRRETTNVPAQSLTLLNDPFVREQAERLAKQALARGTDPVTRIQWLYQTTIGRPATETEVVRAGEFIIGQAALDEGSELDAWRDLAHAMFNLKEFAYLR